jgi:hypothetical protein
MLWAAMTLGTLGLLRSGEFALDERESVLSRKRLRVADVCFIRVGVRLALRLHLRQSKTDVNAAGVYVHVGATGAVVCAVEAMRAFLERRVLMEGPADPEASLFVFSDGALLRRQQLTVLLRELVRQLGMDMALFSGHSFRIGGASDLAHAGAQDHVIQMIGRWSTDTYKRYIVTAPEAMAAFAPMMARVLPGD